MGRYAECFIGGNVTRSLPPSLSLLLSELIFPCASLHQSDLNLVNCMAAEQIGMPWMAVTVWNVTNGSYFDRYSSDWVR